MLYNYFMNQNVKQAVFSEIIESLRSLEMVSQIWSDIQKILNNTIEDIDIRYFVAKILEMIDKKEFSENIDVNLTYQQNSVCWYEIHIKNTTFFFRMSVNLKTKLIELIFNDLWNKSYLELSQHEVKYYLDTDKKVVWDKWDILKKISVI